MKNQPEASRAGWRLASALGLGLGLCLAAAACDSSNVAGPAAPVEPAQLYGQMCARCHGMDGRGDPNMKQALPAIRDFSDPIFLATPDEQIESVIMAGRNQMPGFGTMLSRPKIQHLTGYVRRLGRAAKGSAGSPVPGAAAGSGAAAGGEAAADAPAAGGGKAPPAGGAAASGGATGKPAGGSPSPAPAN